ncbi:hypothetical protein FLA105534_04083 [Flavobacterium bizetiae]|uniref:Macroglobulin domain-containing protein n=1 Tax=Flavobacterium bizetiae TaxID=2704140 RepID=A0A6J4GW80_9FLAO|nr:hypothetical protein [Flavobacterium bizetiae]CAA9202424.1 hypothetical protein FLA105534_04083 [Flavobacterium bizetiae]CAD5344755.1 hypothetical protein FLA105535_04763 [Flavobacterium bizetiae]CAD5350738.1 hypothetical protein FLA105534_04733 [Flavobacterium bizetiae]
MDRLKHILVVILLLSCKQIIFAQNNNSSIELNEVDTNINESVYISTNSNSFLTGETLLYNISCLNKTTNLPSKYSKVAYFKLIDSNKKIITTQKIFLKNGTGNGDFFIPTTLETGTYKIIGYTNWILNKNIDNYFITDIYILNPYKENNVVTTSQNEVSISEPTIDSNISFHFNSKVLANRQKAELSIKTANDDFLKGNYTISVRKSDGFSVQNKVLFNDYKLVNQNKIPNNTINSSDFLLPELRGEIIKGRIKSNFGEINNRKVALSIVGKNYDLKIAKTDEQGRFTFNLEKANTNPNIVIQVLGENKGNYTIEINEPKETDFSSLVFPALQLNSESNKNITERLISSQIENAYYNTKKDSIITTDKFVPFFGTSTIQYKFDDFTRFPTMEETITEIITGVVFRKEKDNYSLLINDYDKNFNSTLPPLVVVDGLILENLNDFFKYNPRNLYSVNVVKGLYYYEAKSFNGLLFFTTKNGDYETNLNGSYIIKPQLLRPVANKRYFQPDYTQDKNTRIPDYRHQLLWLPNADLSTINSNVQFYTSDVSGKFEVTLEGFSATGKPVYVKEIIDVKSTDSN